MKAPGKLQGNGLKYCIRFSGIAVSVLFAGGSLLQTFLAGNGVPPEKIGSLVAALSAAQMITILLFSAAVDRMGSVIRKSGLFIGCMGIFFLVMAPLALFGAPSSSFLYGAALMAGVAFHIFYGLYAVSDYRLPYEIIDMKDYAYVTGACGVIGGAASVGMSALAALLIASFSLNGVMGGMYLVSFACVAGASVLTFRLRSIPFQGRNETEKKKAGLLVTLKLPLFWRLLLPNLLRGVNTGVIGMLATIGMQELDLLPAQTSAMAVVYTAMGIAGGLIFMKLSGKKSSAFLCLLAGCMMLLGMPLLFVWKNFYAFLGVYVLVLLAMQLVDYSVPVILVEVIPYECIGSFTSLRLGTHTGGMALGAMAAGLALTQAPAVLLLGISGLMQFISSLVYYLVCKKKKAA